jgi:hypothetical protein
MDVCPFIPVRDVTVAECVSCAKELGHLLASELDVPVFLYGAAASRDYRKTVAQIRAGEYEGLATRVSWHIILRHGRYYRTLKYPLFVLFNDASYSSDYIASDDSMICE